MNNTNVTAYVKGVPNFRPSTEDEKGETKSNVANMNRLNHSKRWSKDVPSEAPSDSSPKAPRFKSKLLNHLPSKSRIRKYPFDSKRTLSSDYSGKLSNKNSFLEEEERMPNSPREVFDSMNEFEKKLEEIQECHLVSGSFDFLLKTRVANMAAYRELLGETLLRLPSVRESRTYVVMEEVKQTTFVAISAISS